ncbi:MAG: DUF4131 domain-containing protein [Verrucomicrobia bacterium]|nr:DUF4131 domain-containing protein [Verrucomicrobiota bacterium]
MKRPLVPIALAYAGGVLAARACPVELPLWWLITAGALIASLALARASWRARLLWPLLVAAGCANLTSRTAILSRHDLRAAAGSAAELVALRGSLAETPKHRVFIQHEEEAVRTHAVIEVTELRRDGAWLPATGRVAVTTPGAMDGAFFGGRGVEAFGVLHRPKAAAAQGLFDYREHLRWLGIHFQLDTKGTNDWRLAPAAAAPAPPMTDRFFNWAQRTLARGLAAEDESLRLLWAMTLGWKTALTDEVSEPFMRSGTMHIFAISGLHIALIAGILVALLRVAQVPRAWCGLVVVPLIWFYTGATGWQASAIRSTIMMTVIIAGWSLRRPGDLLNSLAAAGVIILVWQPEQLFQASFQLSFFVVLSIALLVPPFEERSWKWLKHDPMLPDELRPRWRRMLDRPLHWLASSIATSLAAWLGSLPLTAYYFHLFTPGSLVANVLVVPLSALALMANLGALVCGGWLPWLTELFNHSAWLWMSLMVRVSEWTATLPGAWTYTRPPTAFEFIAFYALVMLTVSGWLFAPGRRRRVAVAVALLVVCWGAGLLRERATAKITVLAGANAIFADAPGSADDLLVDTGAEGAANFIVKPFLRGQGANRVTTLALTHGDLRNVGGFTNIAAVFQPVGVVTSGVRFRSPAYRGIAASLESSPGRWRQVKRGDTVSGWTVLHPEGTERFTQGDDSALVLRGEFHGTRVLLLSDLGKPGQLALLDSGQDLRAAIVVAGMPTQGEPLAVALLDAVKPRAIVLQDSEYPAQRRAPKQLRDRLASDGVPLFIATADGTTVIEVKPGGVTVRAPGRPAVNW